MKPGRGLVALPVAEMGWHWAQQGTPKGLAGKTSGGARRSPGTPHPPSPHTMGSMLPSCWLARCISRRMLL